VIHVLSPGVLASVQDTGRTGRGALAIGTAGAMDRWAARLANVLLGNPESAPVLELTLGGAELRVEFGTWFALCGADLGASIDGIAMTPGAPVWIEAGSVLRLPGARQGCRACLAVSGGFLATHWLGSASTDLRAGLGGHHGRALQRGDRIAYNGTSPPRAAPRWHTPLAVPTLPADGPLALVEGPALGQLATMDRERLLGEGFTVDRDSDRMGLRLVEALPGAAALAEQLSHAVVFGTVQLPRDGRPIVLGADCQTTGGYPVAGVVAGVDHARIAQARPGDRLYFRRIEVNEAQRRWHARERQLARLRLAVQAWWRG
jgi:antagonist of KipI